jgi:hypothetical protein
VDDDRTYAKMLCDQLGGIFCLTFVKGLDESEALLRMGGKPDTVRTRTAEELESADAGMAAALRLGSWTVVIEPRGSHGAEDAVLLAVSRGTAAVSVLRHDEAAPHFGYAVDATMIAAFDPGYPAEEVRWGSDPGQLSQLLQVVGLWPPADDAWKEAEPRAIMLAQRIAGVTVPPEPLAVPRLSAQIDGHT